MDEGKLLEAIATELRGLRTPKDSYVFKNVIIGMVPPPDAIKNYPSAAFYIAESSYVDNKSYQTVTSEVLIYLYNRHRTSGLSVDDIDSGIIKQVRTIIDKGLDDNNIIQSNVVSSIRDGGSIHPRTVVELTCRIEYVEAKDCKQTDQ